MAALVGSLRRARPLLASTLRSLSNRTLPKVLDPEVGWLLQEQAYWILGGSTQNRSNSSCRGEGSGISSRGEGSCSSSSRGEGIGSSSRGSSNSSSNSSSRGRGRGKSLSSQQVKAATSCAGVADLLARHPANAIGVPAWLSAMDRLLPLGESSGTPREDQEAAQRVLQHAAQQLRRCDAWALVAFIRCAAAFEGSLDPASLAAWQDALRLLSHTLTAQGVSNVLLALGTLAAADCEVPAKLYMALLARLFEHAISLSSGFLPQDAANTLYGAALLGLQPTAPQFEALLAAVCRAPRMVSAICITQLLLAFQKIADTAVQQGQGSKAWKPELHPDTVYYPGNEYMDFLLEHAADLACHRHLQPLQACLSLGACGMLRYMPNEENLAQLLAVVRGIVLSEIEATALLTGCAKLGVQPGPAVLATCWQSVVHKEASEAGSIASLAWALAALQACDVEMWAHLTSTLAARASDLDSMALFQWHAALLHVRQQHGGMVACPPALVERSLPVHQARIMQISGPMTHFHCALVEAVRGLAGDYGLDRNEVEVEYVVPVFAGLGWVKVDIAIPSLRLVVEADGPHHYLRNVDPVQETGETLARNRLLRGAGWDVVGVPHTVFNYLFCTGPQP